MTTKPILGQVVHFHQGGECYAAIIVKIWSDTCVNLYVPPTGSKEPVPGALSIDRNAMSVSFDDKLHGRDWTWHWSGEIG